MNHPQRLDEIRQTYRDPTLSVMAVLLALLIFVVTPLQATIGFAFAPVGAMLVLVMAAGLYVLSGHWITLLPVALAIVLHFALDLLRDEHDTLHPHIYLIASLWLTVSATFAVVVARAVFADGPITTHRIVGAIFPNAFVHMSIADTPRLGADVTYFSLTTITSVGYGDITPAQPIARGLCNLESICGQLYPAILLARLVSLHLEQKK